MADLTRHYHVIKRALFTEKGTYQQERNNTFAFEVHAKANKVQVRQAVEAIFEVKVLKVRTMAVPGKLKRFGWTHGRTAPWKKALVTLREGDAIHQI